MLARSSATSAFKVVAVVAIAYFSRGSGNLFAPLANLSFMLGIRVILDGDLL